MYHVIQINCTHILIIKIWKKILRRDGKIFVLIISLCFEKWNIYQTALSFSRARSKSTVHSPRKTLSPSGQKSHRVTSIARFIKLSPSTPEKSNVAFQIGFWLGSATTVFNVIWSALKRTCNHLDTRIKLHDKRTRNGTVKSTALIDIVPNESELHFGSRMIYIYIYKTNFWPKEQPAKAKSGRRNSIVLHPRGLYRPISTCRTIFMIQYTIQII